MPNKKKILIVDDEPSICEGISLVLTPAGYEVKQALSGEEAVAAVSKEDFDIILMDLIMPGMDGADACETIKSIKPDASIVAISGSPSGQRLDKFLKAGGIELYLYKPFGKEELLRGVERALRGEYVRFREDT
ncbi:MAG: response regulator [Pseudomonadota bacterium]